MVANQRELHVRVERLSPRVVIGVGGALAHPRGPLQRAPELVGTLRKVFERAMTILGATRESSGDVADTLAEAQKRVASGEFGAPVMASGTVSMITNGDTKLSNCAASTR